MGSSGPNESTVSEWTAQQLSDRISHETPFFLLDVRNRNEFDAMRIEGRAPIPTKNVPYFEMLEAADDFVTSIEKYAESTLSGELPKTMPLLAVCAKGSTSRLVAEALGHLGYNATNLAGGMAAWGDHYDVRPAVEEDGLAVLQVSRPARGCLSYVIESDGHAAVIDPGRHIDQYVDLARKRKASIEVVIDTHAHADHVSGGRALATLVNAPYLLHPYDAIHPIDLVPGKMAYEPLTERTSLTLGRAQIRPIWIPGHTLGSVALLVNGDVLLAGDSIFVGSIARPDLGGPAAAWTPLHYQSIRRLLDLPASTLVLPGHFSHLAEASTIGVFGTTLGDLRATNEGVIRASADLEGFSQFILSSLPTFPPEYIEIKRINVGLLDVDGERLTELETGKNQCALAGA
jgi:glyoxylase-like metal-dependent hydrolase (beta-lactamase superfamily II)/rhodanese-related sulfurtransferase